MNVTFADTVEPNTAFVGVGVVNPGETVDVPYDIAQNLIKEGRAAVPPSPKTKPAASKPEPAATAPTEPAQETS